jgi:predicted amidohydrolase YtcJ
MVQPSALLFPSHILTVIVICRYPHERLTRLQALKGMTLDAAYASFAENTVGSLVTGKKADFVVFNADIMSIPSRHILKSRVTAAIVDGNLAYGVV